MIGVAGWDELAEASLTGPALIWTVLTLTGFIGSDEPGMAPSACVWITPLVSGAGSVLAGGTAAAAAAKIDRVTDPVGRAAGAVTGSAAVDAT